MVSGVYERLEATKANEALREQATGKRVLLIVDDAWTAEPATSGAAGSAAGGPLSSSASSSSTLAGREWVAGSE